MVNRLNQWALRNIYNVPFISRQTTQSPGRNTTDPSWGAVIVMGCPFGKHRRVIFTISCLGEGVFIDFYHCRAQYNHIGPRHLPFHLLGCIPRIFNYECNPTGCCVCFFLPSPAMSRPNIAPNKSVGSLAFRCAVIMAVCKSRGICKNSPTVNS